MRVTVKRSARDLLAVYLGVSPVYWLPGLGAEPILYTKVLLLAVAMFFVMTHLATVRVKRLPLGWAGLRGIVLAVVAATGGALASDIGSVAALYVEYLMCGLMILAGYVMAERVADIETFFKIAVSVTSVFALMTLALPALGVDSLSPSALRGLPISQAGFGGGRTGWSNGLAMFAVVATFLFLRTLKQSRPAWLWLASAVAIVSSQIMVNGRAGILAVFLTTLVLVGRLWSWRTAAVLSIASVSLGILAVTQMGDRLASARIDITALSEGDFDAFDAFASGRLITYEAAVGAIKDRPMLGYGFDDWQESGVWGRYFVHNLWLKLWYQGGVFYLLFNAILIGAIARHAYKGATRASTSLGGLLAILAALVISVFEPNFPLGTFQNSAAFWTLGGIATRWAQVTEQT